MVQKNLSPRHKDVDCKIISYHEPTRTEDEEPHAEGAGDAEKK